MRLRLRPISITAALVTIVIACSSTETPPGGTGGSAGLFAGAGRSTAGATSGGAGGMSGAPTSSASGGMAPGTAGTLASFSGAGSGGAPAPGGAGFAGTPPGAGGFVQAGSSGATGRGGSAGLGGNAANSGGGGKGGNAGTGGMVTQCTPPTGNNQGYTTRFWDCCKPSCSWPNNTGGRNPAKSCNRQNGSTGSGDQSACSGGGAFACWDMSPWAASETKAYGFAAFNGGSCGQCYELKFTGQSNSAPNDPGSASLCGKSMIVQVVNIGGITQGQFDLMIPGGGVGDFNACTNQWNVSGSALGERYGGVLLACQRQNNEYEAKKSCTTAACNTLFSNSSFSTLLSGCKWQVDWLHVADNPKVIYQQVACPQEITAKSGLQ